MDITGLVGDSVRLPCEIDEDKCGDVHNIQWYRGDGDTRVFIYSELANVDTSENMLQGRSVAGPGANSATGQPSPPGPPQSTWLLTDPERRKLLRKSCHHQETTPQTVMS